MPLDNLPGFLIVPSSDAIVQQYLRDVRIRNPNAKTIQGTQEYTDAKVFADQALPLYFDAKACGDFVANVNKQGGAVDTELARAGTVRLPPIGGSGAVTITTSAGGANILLGDEIKDPLTGLRFQCLAAGLYQNGAQVPISGIDTGPSTNLPAQRLMQWTTPRPGCAQNATIVLAADGVSGLLGGRTAETDAQAIARLAFLRANPPAAGNDAQFQAAAQATPGISVQQVFTYPCIVGPGSMGLCFTLRPGTPGANRIPSAAQNAVVLANLIGQFPADDSILLCTLVASPQALIFQVTWAPNAVAWADATTWPVYVPGDTVRVDNAGTLSATAFRLTTGTATTTPAVGQSIHFYDQPNGVFRKKKILTVAVVVAGKSWDLTVDTTNSVSDVTYVPSSGQTAGPWSDSLAGLVPGVVSFFDALGPGEQLSPMVDPNLRKRRSPRSPAVYANTITNRIVSPLFALPTIQDVVLASPAVPFATPTGSIGISSNLLTLSSIAVFPQS